MRTRTRSKSRPRSRTSIERIQNLQAQLVASSVSFFIVLGTTVAPLVSSMFFNYLSCGRWFAQCDVG